MGRKSWTSRAGLGTPRGLEPRVSPSGRTPAGAGPGEFGTTAEPRERPLRSFPRPVAIVTAAIKENVNRLRVAARNDRQRGADGHVRMLLQPPAAYLGSDQSYRASVCQEGRELVYDDRQDEALAREGAALSPSTVWRWLSWLSGVPGDLTCRAG